MPDETSPLRASRWVFVYGTLRKGCSNDITRLQPPPRFVGRGRIAGILYHLGAYPGVTLGGAQWVEGEVYAIEPALETVLDDIESLGENPTDEYIKREIDVEVEGAVLPCLVYEINPRYVMEAPRIPEGDWVKFL